MKKCILFVDDEPNILQGLQRVLRRLLRKEPYDILTAHSAAEALATLARGPVNVILKPCDEHSLTTTLLSALQQKGQKIAERQKAVLQQLEKEDPGITKVERDTNGAVLLNEEQVDLETLVQTIHSLTTTPHKHPETGE